MKEISKLIQDYENKLIDIENNRESDNKEGDHSFYMEYDTSKENINEFIGKLNKLNKNTMNKNTMNKKEIISLVKKLTLTDVGFELPSDDIFDMPEVNLQNPLEEFYYYERPAYLKYDQKQFRERLQKALNYLKGNYS